nr:hypothetical protein [uncultured Flavobacterium sp.]
MNKRILKISTLVTLLVFSSQYAVAQQGFGTEQPSKASVIEMNSESKGLLIPRVALKDLTHFDPIKGELGTNAEKVNALLVYNTASLPTYNIIPGYYYWTTDGTLGTWKRLLATDDTTALHLLGDVTGTLGATTVVKLQGRDIANTNPNANQVLTWNGSAWEPKNITPTAISDRKNVTAASNKVTLGGNPVGATLEAFSIDVAEANLTLSNIGGKVTNNQITQGTAGQVLVTNTDGSSTSWVDQSVISPTTTNVLSSAQNTMTSTVNGIEKNANIINTNALSLNSDNELVSTINGVSSTGLDLGLVVKTNETVTSLSQDASTGVITYKPEEGANQTANVVSTKTGNLISFDNGAFLNASKINENQKTSSVVSGNTKTATVTANTPQGSNNTEYTVTVKAPNFFYMPSVIFNTDNKTTGTTVLQRDLYELYKNQFEGTTFNIIQGANIQGTASINTSYEGLVGSTGAPATIYTYGKRELHYYVTYYDKAVFSDLSINEDGVLSYKIIGEASPMSFMNIVFVVK